MPELILTDEQAKVVNGAFGPITVRDLSGNVLGHLEPKLSPEVIAELKRRAATGPRYSGDQVQARLQALEREWERTGGFDEAYMRAFLAQMDVTDPPYIRERGRRE